MPTTSSPHPPSPDRDECLGGPNPCSHACHNAPGRFSCSCPAGFALAEDDRSCRGEWAPRGRLPSDLGRCVQDPGLFLRTLNASLGLPMPCPHFHECPRWERLKS